MEKLFILYDANCQFCLRCRSWLETQPAYFVFKFIPARSSEAHRPLPGIEKYESANELIVVSEDGAVYQGPAAFIMCLYALADFREWSLRLSSPLLLPFARQMFEFISSNRLAVSRWLRKSNDDEIARSLERCPPPLCGNENMSCLLAAKQNALTTA
ncbi:MAG: DCC1-like thiol-disulfide oxidoreductase family protein [Verrucomicrobiota bacterium]